MDSVKSTGQKTLFDVDVMQFMMPNGKQNATSTKLPTEYREAYLEMQSAGCRFEAEMLSDYKSISVTISNPKDEEDIDISLTANGPEVQAGMVAMLERKLWKKLLSTQLNENTV